MVVDRGTGGWSHKKFFEIADELNAGDVLVLNNTKVFKARLQGTVDEKEIELFLLRPLDEDGNKSVWEAMAKPGRRLNLRSKIILSPTLYAVAIKKTDTFQVQFNATIDHVFSYADKHGEIPVPPYVDEKPAELDQYQTVYARERGSVAAPTAGFHFTDTLIATLKSKGVQFEFVTLHVGLGTFRPMKSETIEEHVMHEEWVDVSAEVAGRINQAKAEGRRVIAVGTTTVRVLEGSLQRAAGSLQLEEESSSTGLPAVSCLLPASGYTGPINLFITPGFNFKIIDGLITNFHLPKSTLLVLVSSFLGREKTLACYQEAIKEGYRYYSFGDAMFIR